MDEPTKHWSSSYFWRSLCINDSDTEASHVSTSLSTWIAKMNMQPKWMCLEWIKYSPGHEMIEQVLTNLGMETSIQEEFLYKGLLQRVTKEDFSFSK